MITYKIKTPQLLKIFEEWGDENFFKQREIQIIEIFDNYIEENRCTKIFIFNEINPKINKEILIPSLRVLSYYNLFKILGWRIPLFLFRPFVNTYQYRLLNTGNRKIKICKNNFDPEKLNDSEYSLCSDDGFQNIENIIKSFLAGCQPIVPFDRVSKYFDIPNIIKISNNENIHEIIKNPPLKYDNYFRGCLAEEYGFMENFVNLEEKIKSIIR